MGCVQSRVLPGSEKVPYEKNPNILSGDVTKKKEAKYEREMKLRERQQIKTVAAEKFSAKLMDDTERLSLGTRSRGTSRATSRAGSPAPTGRKQVHFKSDEVRVFKSSIDSNTSSSIGNGSIFSNGKNSKLDNKNQNINTTTTVVTVVPVEGKENSSIKSQDSKQTVQLDLSSVTKSDIPNGQVSNSQEQVTDTQSGSVGEKLATIDERASSRCSSKSEKEVKRG